ncbi:outer membrane protein assembly factor BamB [Pseudomaricurvus sp.]|uniref:outer membrane protein assembly factor BamB n=1 Tax=Pseudomaricurvus sp. TaxID=2004510 RepID=UPI003F6B28E9
MKRVLLLGLISVLAACSSNDEVDLEPADLVDFDETVEIDRLWSEGVGMGAGKTYTLLPIAVDGDRVFAVDAEGLVKSINRSSGDENWEVELETSISSGVGASSNHVFVGTLKGEVIALDAATGAEQWRTRLSSEILSPPQSNGSELAVQTLDGKLYGLSVSDGSQLWMNDSSIPALTLRGTSTPLITSTSVYAGFATGKVMALDVKDGTPQWEQRVAAAQGRSELERVVDINAAPMLVGDILYAVSYQGRLVALNRGTGQGLWAQKASSFNNLGSGMGYVYISDADDSVKAYDARSGALIWENDQLSRRQIGAPQAFGRFVAVADFEGYVHIMNQSDGQFVARRKVDGDGVRTPMVGVGDTLYVYGNSGDLEALTEEEE